jgi:hypothetical protein
MLIFYANSQNAGQLKAAAPIFFITSHCLNGLLLPLQRSVV